MKKILFLLATTVALGCNNPQELNLQIKNDLVTLVKEGKKVAVLNEIGYKDEAIKVLTEQLSNIKSIKERYEHLIEKHSFDLNDDEFKDVADNYITVVKLKRTFELARRELGGK